MGWAAVLLCVHAVAERRAARRAAFDHERRSDANRTELFDIAGPLLKSGWRDAVFADAGIVWDADGDPFDGGTAAT